MIVALLTLLLGVGVYVLYYLCIILFLASLKQLGIELAGISGWLAFRHFLVVSAINVGFSIMAVAIGRRLIARLMGQATRSGGVRAVLAIILLGLALAILKPIFLYLSFNGIAWALYFLTGDPSLFIRLFGDIALYAANVGFLVAAVALGRFLLGRPATTKADSVENR